MKDLLADTLSIIKNAERVGKRECKVPKSNLIEQVLKIMKEKGHIKNYAISEKGFKIELSGKINNCGAIKPRFSVGKEDYEKYEKRFLPSRSFGYLIISTSKGVLSNEEAKKKGVGGKILSFVY